ncbi:hypothetical protein OAO87_00310 [bacterium]|nr:hypothetical protein [bacterium]
MTNRTAAVGLTRREDGTLTRRANDGKLTWHGLHCSEPPAWEPSRAAASRRCLGHCDRHRLFDTLPRLFCCCFCCRCFGTA